MRKRFILIHREHGSVLGDTSFDWSGQPVPAISNLSPARAAAMLQSCSATDQYPYRYRVVRRSHPNAVFDAYRAPPGFPPAFETAPNVVIRECEYAASLARIDPHCSVCRRPMAPSERGIDTPWLYGYTVDWNDPRAKRCCSRCYVNRVLPARLKAEGNS